MKQKMSKKQKTIIVVIAAILALAIFVSGAVGYFKLANSYYGLSILCGIVGVVAEIIFIFVCVQVKAVNDKCDYNTKIIIRSENASFGKVKTIKHNSSLMTYVEYERIWNDIVANKQKLAGCTVSVITYYTTNYLKMLAKKNDAYNRRHHVTKTVAFNYEVVDESQNKTMVF